MLSLRGFCSWVARSSKRIAVTLVGTVLVLAGLVLMVTPGPGWLAVIAGLAVLGTEYAWARAAMEGAKSRAARARDRMMRRSGTGREEPPPGARRGS